jgi:hypothetical protein
VRKTRLWLSLLLLWSGPVFAAVSAANKIATGTTTCSTPITTASVAPGANKLILVTVHNALSSGNGADVATVDGSGVGLTFVQVATQLFGATQGAGKVDRISVFRGMGSSPTAGTISISWPQNQGRCEWIVDEISGMDASGTNGSGAIVQSPSNFGSSGQPASVTMGAFGDAGNGTFAGAASHSTYGFSAGTSMTLLGQSNAGWSAGTDFAAGNVSPATLNWNTTSTSWGIIGIEIKAAGSVAAPRRRVQVTQ